MAPLEYVWRPLFAWFAKWHFPWGFVPLAVCATVVFLLIRAVL